MATSGCANMKRACSPWRLPMWSELPGAVFSKTPARNIHCCSAVSWNQAGSDEALAKLVPQYTTRTDVFICPGTKEDKLPTAQPLKGKKISYAYLMGLTSKAPADQWIMSDWLVDTKPHKTNEIIFSADGSKPGNNHDKYGGVILFVDGNVEISKPKAKFPIATPAGTKILNPPR